MSFRADLRHDGGVALIKLDGALDALSAPVFRDRIKRAAEHPVRLLVLDMANVNYLSSAGLRTLVYARQKMRDGSRITIVGANDVIQRTIQLMGFQYGMEFGDGIP
ncbi:MAG TPA: STAS domain-containing protein [Micromonosporaceae bacterium]